MNYFNFKISQKRAKFYQSSKEPRDGFEKVEYGMEEPKKVTYHKYLDKLHGVVKSVGVKEIQYDGRTLKFFELVLVDGDNQYAISASLRNAKGTNYTTEVKQIVSCLDNYTAGEPVTVSLSNKTSVGKDGKEYTNFNMYMNYQNILDDNGRGKSTGYIPFDQIPKSEVEEVAGEKLYTFKAQMNFYYEKIKALSEKFPFTQQAVAQTAPPPAQQPTPSAAPAPAAKPAPAVENDDDLPF